MDCGVDSQQRGDLEQTHTFSDAGWELLMDLRDKLRSGLVIPAHPLALNSNRKLDERRQRALTKYYLAAGAGGIAVAVHTTQFEIRDPNFRL